MADSYDKLERLCLKYMNEDDFSNVEQATALLPRSTATKSGARVRCTLTIPSR